VEPARKKSVKKHIVECIVSTNRSWITLTPRPTKKLPIDPSRFVGLGRDNMQSPEGLDPFTQLNICPPPGHVGSDRHPSFESRIGNNSSLLRQPGGIQNYMFDIFQAELSPQLFT
jgi:hypothetical protein